MERLNKWLSELSREALEKVALECVDRLIDIEEISFFGNYTAPYWSANGEPIDGSELEETNP